MSEINEKMAPYPDGMLPKGYAIRQAALDDIPDLPGIERSAADLFIPDLETLGLTADGLTHTNSIADFKRAQQAGHLWVAIGRQGQPVGFAFVVKMGDYAHLEELDVLPTHGRRGLGTALVNTVCAWATAEEYLAVTLRTFRDVPWNGPFYQQCGFQIVASAQLSSAHVELEALEESRGLLTELRVTMMWPTVR